MSKDCNMNPVYDIIHNNKHYTVFMSGKLCSLYHFKKEDIKITCDLFSYTKRIKGEITELKDYSKISGGKMFYNLIMEGIKDYFNE